MLPGYRVLAVVFIVAHLLMLQPSSALAKETRSAATHGELLQWAHAGVEAENFSEHYDRQRFHLKLKDDFQVRQRNGRWTAVNLDAVSDPLSPALGLGALKRLEQEILDSGGSIRSMISVPESRLTDWVQNAQAATSEKVPDINHYFTVQLSKESDASAVTVANRFEQLDMVEAVHFIPLQNPSPPAASSTIPDYSDRLRTFSDGNQWYLEPAPLGVGARYAWEGFRGDGAGITICDLEYNANFTHSEFSNIVLFRPPMLSPRLSGDDPTGKDHGSAVFGIIGGRKDGIGVTGIAHGARMAFVCQTDFRGQNDIANAIYIALNNLDPGDVLLLEAQTSGPNRPTRPDDSNPQLGLVAVTWSRPVYDAVRVGVLNGITVVAAAGNGTQNLDAPEYSTSVNGWPNGQGPFQLSNDTGMIMVGSGRPSFPTGISTEPIWNRNGDSNFGATVDVFSWGASLTTAGQGSLLNLAGENFDYRNDFGGTSGASAIIAGVAGVVQALYQTANDEPASAATMRTLLRTGGTTTLNEAGIGVMPNLRSVILSLAADGVAAPEPPVANPPPGFFAGLRTVTLTTPESLTGDYDTVIHYALDGTNPTLESPVFPQNNGELALNQSVEIRAAVFRRDPELQRWFRGPIGIYQYQQAQLQTATPQFNPAPGVTSVLPKLYPIQIFSATPGAEILYRLDGNHFKLRWLRQGTVYNGPLTLESEDYEIIAMASAPGFLRSDVSETFSISILDTISSTDSQEPAALAPPRIYPVSGTYYGSLSIEPPSTSPGIEIRYTLDGSDPNPDSPLLDKRIELTDSGQLQAKAFSANLPTPRW